MRVNAQPLASVCWRWGGGVELGRCDAFCKCKTIFVKWRNKNLQSLLDGATHSSENRCSKAWF